MNTFHIKPESSLARLAVEQVRELADENPSVLVAVRGQRGIDDDGTEEWEAVYSVSPCPDQANPGKYEWEYVHATEWLERYYDLH